VGSLSHRAELVYFSLPFTNEYTSSDRAVLKGFALLDEVESLTALSTLRAPLTPAPLTALLRLIRPQRGPVASFGRVLGNKRTLYKYRNIRLVVALTQYICPPAGSAVLRLYFSGTDWVWPSEPGEHWCGVHLLDSVNGR